MKKGIKMIVLFLLGVLIIVGIIFLYARIYENDFLPEDPQQPYNCKSGSLTTLPLGIVCDSILRNDIETVLYYYPELQNSNITFLFDNISSTMNVQPIIDFSIFKKESRKYKITINKNEGKVIGLDFFKMDKETRIGWFAHELSHIVDYTNKSSFDLLCFLINYFTSKHFIKETEKRIDKSVIYRGLGNELIRGVAISTTSSELSKEYQNKLKRLYLSPIELDSIRTDYESKCKL